MRGVRLQSPSEALLVGCLMMRLPLFDITCTVQGKKEKKEKGGDVEGVSMEELNQKITTLEKEKNKEEEYRNYMQLERVRSLFFHDKGSNEQTACCPDDSLSVPRGSSLSSSGFPS